MRSTAGTGGRPRGAPVKGLLLEELRAWLELAETQVLPKSPLGRAIGYARNQWPALLRYLDDGRGESWSCAAKLCPRAW